MQTLRNTIVALGALAVLAGPTVSAQQGLTFALFERYLDVLREQSAIPGLSAGLVQGGRLVWERGFGYADVDRSIRAAPETPYPILGLSQTLSSTLLLRHCAESGRLGITDPVRRWNPTFADGTLTIAQVLSHRSASGDFAYDAARYAALDEVIRQCANHPYAALLASQLFDGLAMVDSVPGLDLADASAPHRALFAGDRLERYAAVLARLAVPYRVDDRGRATASAYAAQELTAAAGAVSTVRDLAQFDRALRDGLLTPETLRHAWAPAGGTTAGLGWFVQSINTETVVWQFGVAADAYSSLIIKVPGRDLTLILLANSDRLNGPYALERGDLNASLFARLFFRLFLV